MSRKLLFAILDIREKILNQERAKLTEDDWIDRAMLGGALAEISTIKMLYEVFRLAKKYDAKTIEEYLIEENLLDSVLEALPKQEHSKLISVTLQQRIRHEKQNT